MASQDQQSGDRMIHLQHQQEEEEGGSIIRPEQEEQFDVRWAAFESQLSQGKAPSPEEYMAIYTGVYEMMCLDIEKAEAFGHKLYTNFPHLVDSCITHDFSSLIKNHDFTIHMKGENDIEDFLKQWKSFTQRIHLVSHVCNYLDRFYIARNELTPLNEVALARFNKKVFQRARESLKIEFVALVQRRRDGKSINEPILHDLVDLFSQLKIEKKSNSLTCYEELEAFILQKATNYYLKKSMQWPVDIYEKNVREAMHYERDFAEKFLLKESVSKLEKAIEKAFQEAKERSIKNEKESSKDVEFPTKENKKAPLYNCSTNPKLWGTSKLDNCFQTTNA